MKYFYGTSFVKDENYLFLDYFLRNFLGENCIQISVEKFAGKISRKNVLWKKVLEYQKKISRKNITLKM